MRDPLRLVILDRWARLATERPIVMLALCLALAAAGIIVTAARLEFHSDRSDLVDADLPWNAAYAQYRTAFPAWDDLVLVVDALPDDPRVDAALLALADALPAGPAIDHVTAFTRPEASSPRLAIAGTDAEWNDRYAALRQWHAFAAAPHGNAAIAALGALVRSNDDDATTTDVDATALLDVLRQAVDGAPIDLTTWRAPPRAWFVVPGTERRLRTIFVAPALDDAAGVDAMRASVVATRTLADAHLAPLRDTIDLDWGVTGLGAIESDETAQSIADSTLASIVAFALITALMIVVFRGVTVPLIAAGSVLVGMAWSFGWLVLAVGHLQLLSVVFTVILLGLGIDFALHLIARLELTNDGARTLTDATRHAFVTVGPGLVTGAITTAAAFGSTAFTDFRGMAEMGVISAGGIVLCLIAVLTAVPAGLALLPSWHRAVRARAESRRIEPDDHAGRRRARGLLLTGLAGFVVLASFGVGVRYDPNVLNLHPPHVESTAWEARLASAPGSGTWAAIVLTDAERAAALADALRAEPQIGELGAMGTLVPPNAMARATALAELAATPVPPLVSAGADAFGAILDAMPDGALAATWRALDDATRTARWQAFDAALVPLRDDAAAFARAVTPPRALTADDLAPELRARWTNGDTWLVRVAPAPDPAGRSVLHPDRLDAFVAAVRRAAPEALGPPIQIAESTTLIIRAYRRAALAAVAVIALILLIDFRSIVDTVLAMVPVTLGFGGMFGVMALLGVPLNFANIIVMPLIFGIGVDAGVHLVHRWRLEPDRHPAGLGGGTGRGVMLTMLTTTIGFGCMLLAEHRGIRSLGAAMVAGLLVTLLACRVVLSPLLHLRQSPEK